MKDWPQLDCSDFESADSEDASPTATISFQGADVTLTIDDASEANDSAVQLFHELLSGWEKRLDKITKKTEKYVQVFLPGRKIAPRELALWGLTLYTDDGDPTAATFHFHVTGEYIGSKYKLDQFDQESVVELQYPIDDNSIEWSSGELAATNDFD